MLLIREMRAEDVFSVKQIYSLYWSGEFLKHICKRLGNPGFIYFVAKENGEVVGAASLRNAPDHMKKFATTSNPAEFYVIAVKEKGRGIGTALRNARIETARKLGYTEILLFSAESHKDSWAFHDNSDFKRIAQTAAPNGEPGYIWRMLL